MAMVSFRILVSLISLVEVVRPMSTSILIPPINLACHDQCHLLETTMGQHSQICKGLDLIQHRHLCVVHYH